MAGGGGSDEGKGIAGGRSMPEPELELTVRRGPSATARAGFESGEGTVAGEEEGGAGLGVGLVLGGDEGRFVERRAGETGRAAAVARSG